MLIRTMAILAGVETETALILRAVAFAGGGALWTVVV
jgi:hypothetical protein